MSQQNALPVMKGHKSGLVGRLQSELNKWLEPNGHEPLHVDGIFGPKTEAAVRIFQAANKLLVDGIIGRNTFGRLVPVPPANTNAYPRHNIVLFDADEVVNRALSTIGSPVTYHLEYPNGGTDPNLPGPADEQTSQLDCSGFNAWVQGFDRDFMDGMSETLDKWDGYCNSNSKISEAKKEGLLFTIIATGEGPVFTAGVHDVQPGDMIVAGDVMEDGKRLRIGHEGTIVGLGPKFILRGLAEMAVVHCSASNKDRNEHKSAIWKTNGLVWKIFPKWYILRFNREYAHDKLVELRSK